MSQLLDNQRFAPPHLFGDFRLTTEGKIDYLALVWAEFCPDQDWKNLLKKASADG
jgi:hypothetical protein